MLITINNKYFSPNKIRELKYILHSSGEYAIYIDMIGDYSITLKEGTLPEDLNLKGLSYLEKEKYYFEKYINKDLNEVAKQINDGILTSMKLENQMLLDQQNKFQKLLKRYSV